MAVRSRVRFQAADIWQTPEDGRIYEVIDGELYVAPSPGVEHQRVSGNLHGYLWQYLRTHPLGEVFAAPLGVVLDEEDGVQPDLVYVSSQRASIITERGIEEVPDLVVEVLSPGTEARDRGLKLRRYAHAGVPHYWIVDPRQRILEAYRLDEEGYVLAGMYGPGSVFRPELFPGLELHIDALWGSG